MQSKLIKILTSLAVSLYLLTSCVWALEEVVVGGDTVGIVLNYDGILITGSYCFELDGQTIDPAKQDQLKKGDFVLYVEDQPINTIQQFYNALKKKAEKVNRYTVTVRRNGRILDVPLDVYYLKDEDVYKTGYYVKEKISGVGTVTFYDPVNGVYGALGHEIVDSDTQDTARFSTGTIHSANVTSLKKSIPGNPGEKIASVQSKTIATIERNTVYGLYGSILSMPQNHQKIAIGTQDEAHPGNAVMLTSIHGSEIEAFDINITKVNHQTSPAIKGIEFELVDSRLLQETGGIIQGMSGSPIIQDGKLIGAVTHMITSDPSRGYGLFIEWMIAASAD